MNKKDVKKKALELWPECPDQYLEECFYFKNKPEPEWIVSIGKFAQDVGINWNGAEAFQKLLMRIDSNMQFAKGKFPGELIENVLLEIHLDFMRAIQFASCWSIPKSPMHGNFGTPDYFEKALERNLAATEELYGSLLFVDDGKSICQYIDSKQPKETVS